MFPRARLSKKWRKFLFYVISTVSPQSRLHTEDHLGDLSQVPSRTTGERESQEREGVDRVTNSKVVRCKPIRRTQKGIRYITAR